MLLASRRANRAVTAAITNLSRSSHPRHTVTRVASTFATAEELEKKYVVPTYSNGGVRTKDGLVLSHGKGCYLYDTQGNKYLDFSAGIAVNCLGHGNTELNDAVKHQLDQLTHVSNLYHSEPYLAAAKKLVDISPGFSKAFFCNSGTEANEAAIKFSRILSNFKRSQVSGWAGMDKTRYISFKGSFHGRTLGALSMTWKPAIREPFGPLLNNNVTFLPFNDVDALREAFGSDVCAVIVEPVQGEGGITPASREFMQSIRKLCTEYGAAMICDEIQIGLGRAGSGKLYGHQTYDIVPDFMTLAKPLAGGLPMGAVLVSDSVDSVIPSTKWLGTHGTTFGANPVVCRAAQVVLGKISEDKFLDDVKQVGEHLVQGLRRIAKQYPNKIKEVRAPLGDEALYAGIEFYSSGESSAVVQAAMKRGVLVITAGDTGTVVRICPPLILSKDEVDKGLAAIQEAIEEVVPDKNLNAAPQSAQHSSNVAMTPCEWPSTFSSESEYIDHLNTVGLLPDGFKMASTSFKFHPKELGPNGRQAAMNLSVISMDEPTEDYAALFTRNAFPGAPIVVGREIVRARKKLAAIVVNNKISNVHPQGGGIQDAQAICQKVATALGVANDPNVAVLPSSTGVIGWRLPVDEIMESVDKVVAELKPVPATVGAKAIMTTDSFPKVRAATVTLADGTKGRVVGIAKGAGMVEPNLATMLVFLMTDIKLPGGADDLYSALSSAAGASGSFNRITVDADQSTSDTLTLISSGKCEARTEQERKAFRDAVANVCTNLAEDVVRNGEGTKHVIQVQVAGAPSQTVAIGAGKAVANSPLVKTAVAGNDPNVGRILAALGSYLGNTEAPLAEAAKERCTISIGGIVVFKNGEFQLDGDKEAELVRYMKSAELFQGEDAPGFPAHYNKVEIVIDLKLGQSSCTTLGSDLTHEYVTCNAEYRS